MGSSRVLGHGTQGRRGGRVTKEVKRLYVQDGTTSFRVAASVQQGGGRLNLQPPWTGCERCRRKLSHHSTVFECLRLLGQTFEWLVSYSLSFLPRLALASPAVRSLAGFPVHEKKRPSALWGPQVKSYGAARKCIRV